MSSSNNAPSPWVERFATLIRDGGTVLDLACGGGRHTRYCMGCGYRLVAVDVDVSGLSDLAGANTVEIVRADLEGGDWPLPLRHFDGIVVTNYLHRPLLPLLPNALAPGGVLIYETFAKGNEKFGRPSNPAFLLDPGELLDALGSRLRIVAYEHGFEERPRPAVRQRVCAIKLGSRARRPIGSAEDAPHGPDGHAEGGRRTQAEEQARKRVIDCAWDEREIAVDGSVGSVEGEPASERSEAQQNDRRDCV